MPRFFVEHGNDERITITGDDAVHITKSLRMKAGESVQVCDSAAYEYDCKIESTGESVVLQVLSKTKSDVEPPYFATVYQALVKGDKFDTVVQKAVECGASRIVPFISERCVVRVNKKDCEKKVERWQRIAKEAAKQSGRAIIPQVSSLLTFDEMLKEAQSADAPLFLYESERQTAIGDVLKQKNNKTFSLVIGSEGGFSIPEAERAVDAGMISVGLGKRILRTETASSFALACLSYEYELSK